MKIPVAEAVLRLEKRCFEVPRSWPPTVEIQPVMSRFRHSHAEKIIPYVEGLIGRAVPSDLSDFYKEAIFEIADFRAIRPAWNDYLGRWMSPDSLVTELLPENAIPLFYDGCGSKFALDLTPGADAPAVYFFDHEVRSGGPTYAAASSLGAFLLIAADHDRAYRENWPEKWELQIDPDIDKCPRAPPIWAAG